MYTNNMKKKRIKIKYKNILLMMIMFIMIIVLINVSFFIVFLWRCIKNCIKMHYKFNPSKLLDSLDGFCYININEQLTIYDLTQDTQDYVRMNILILFYEREIFTFSIRILNIGRHETS